MPPRFTVEIEKSVIDGCPNPRGNAGAGVGVGVTASRAGVGGTGVAAGTGAGRTPHGFIGWSFGVVRSGLNVFQDSAPSRVTRMQLYATYIAFGSKAVSKRFQKSRP